MVRKAALAVIVVMLVLVVRLQDVYRGPSIAPARSAGSVVILGDSVARGLSAHLGSAVNLGIDGARTVTVSRRLPTFLSLLRSGDAIVLSIGGNDLFGDVRARVVSMAIPSLAIRSAVGRVHDVVDAIRRENASARIYLLGVYNPYRNAPFGAWVDEQVANWDAQLIESFSRTPAVTVVRIADLLELPGMISAADHFHPSAAGYAAIAARIGISAQSRVAAASL